MGKADIESKEYMRDAAHFADAVNYYVFDGRQVVHPDALTPLDTTEISIPYGNGARTPEQKFRDVMNLWNAMIDDQAVYIILGAENQTEVHYAMPVKSGLYDFMNYAQQVSEAARSYRNRSAKSDKAVKDDKAPCEDNTSCENNTFCVNNASAVNKSPDAEKQAVSLTGGEFLSGFRKEDKLMPVITLVMYFSDAEWDGPMTIHEMLSTQNRQILDMVQDYKIHLVAPVHIPDEDFDKFRTDLGFVLQYIKYSNDKDRLDEIVYNADKPRVIDPDSAGLINAVTGSKLKIVVNEEGKIDMCKAIDEMRKESEDKGRIEGRIEGHREGRIEGSLETLVHLVQKGLLSLIDAANEAGLTPDEFRLKMKGIS